MLYNDKSFKFIRFLNISLDKVDILFSPKSNNVKLTLFENKFLSNSINSLFTKFNCFKLTKSLNISLSNVVNLLDDKFNVFNSINSLSVYSKYSFVDQLINGSCLNNENIVIFNSLIIL